jgi:predicted Zn-dependent protease with MMP-like domain
MESTREERERFDELVEEALEDLPPEIAARMQNVDVVVKAWPSRRILKELGMGHDETLLGYYHGIPLDERTTTYGNVLPDFIEVYREPILDEADATCLEDGDFEKTVREVIRTTVLHEIGHHFGLSEDDLDRLDYG